MFLIASEAGNSTVPHIQMPAEVSTTCVKNAFSPSPFSSQRLPMPFDHVGIMGISAASRHSEGALQAPAALVVKSISVGSWPPSGAFSQLQASEAELVWKQEPGWDKRTDWTLAAGTGGAFDFAVLSRCAFACACAGGTSA